VSKGDDIVTVVSEGFSMLVIAPRLASELEDKLPRNSHCPLSCGVMHEHYSLPAAVAKKEAKHSFMLLVALHGVLPSPLDSAHLLRHKNA
jgi:hypothetical protein